MSEESGSGQSIMDATRSRASFSGHGAALGAAGRAIIQRIVNF